MGSFIIGVDTGGTFTDVFAANGSEAKWTKVWTTHHDLTVCLMEGIQQIADLWGLTVRELLSKTELVRYGTTVGTNALIQKSGPKLGVIVTKPFEANLYAPDGSFPPQLAALVKPEMVFGVRGEVDASGEVKEWPDDDEIRAVVEKIVDLGARAVVVSLRGAAANRDIEMKVKRVILEERPPQYLGSAPHFLGSAISATPDDARRTNTAIVNAYLHRDMVRYLYKAEDNLRNQGLRRPLLITHCTGGVAKVAKTVALHTYGSGPVACVLGCARMGQESYGLKDFVSIDVGGTSVDIGVVKGGETALQRQPVIEGVALDMPMVYVRSVSGGGGAIARLRDGRLTVGPESAGNLPGPAAYQLGGTEPTVCDAQLILGYLDPNYYFGGKKKLNRDLAVQAMRRRIADKSGQTVEEAALAILRRQEEEVAVAMRAEFKAERVEPEQLTLFVAGGNGGMHCCSYAALLNIPRVIASRMSAVASAYGACLLDVVHLYRLGSRLTIRRDQAIVAAEASALDDVLAALTDKARRDMIGEGFEVEQLQFLLEAELEGASGVASLALPFVRFDAARVPELFDLYARSLGVSQQADELVLKEIRLKAVCPTPHHRLAEYESVGSDASEAIKSTRTAWWPQGAIETTIYDRDRLQCGNEVAGPAILESYDTTQLVPPEWHLTVDKFLNGVIERKGP